MEHNAQSSEALFCEYVDCLSAVQPLKDYCTGLLTPCERKSVEPMAAPSRVCPEHPSLLHFVGQASWSDDAALDKARELVLPAIEAQGEIEARIVDDTGVAGGRKPSRQDRSP